MEGTNQTATCAIIFSESFYFFHRSTTTFRCFKDAAIFQCSVGQLSGEDTSTKVDVQALLAQWWHQYLDQATLMM